MEFSRIILRPYQSEKTYAQQSSASPKYAFVVDPKANKFDISIAFETIYGHKPVAISTQLKKPSATRTGTVHPGFTKLTKIAYITLPKGVSLAPEQTEEIKKDVEETIQETDGKTDDVKKTVIKKGETK
jgi:ribosomal protein L23